MRVQYCSTDSFMGTRRSGNNAAPRTDVGTDELWGQNLQDKRRPHAHRLTGGNLGND
jgi:hypothetical protein